LVSPANSAVLARDPDFEGRKEPIASVHSLIVTAPSWWDQRVGFEDYVVALMKKSGFLDINIVKLTGESVSLRTTSLKLLNRIRSILSDHGLLVESDAMIRVLTTGNPTYLADPTAPTWYFEPTEVARRGTPVGPVAFDYTMGSSAVGIMVIDTPLDQFESGLWANELRSPSGGIISSAGPVSHGTPVSYIVHGFANAFQSFGICPGCTRQFRDIDIAGATGTGC
jgi:hypothetical protein